MKKKKYRAVVVGCGKIGALFEAEPKRPKPASHAGAIVANRRTELVALVDTNSRNLAKAGKLFPRAARYASLLQCLKTERPDVVVVATPLRARLSIIRACVKAGTKIVICEKPLATHLPEAETIKKLLTRSRITFVLNYQRRFSPLYERVCRDIKRDAIGRVQQVTCYYSNGLYNNGGHIIDALLYLLEERIVSVIGIEKLNNKMHPTGDINIDGILRTSRGVNVVLQSLDQRAYAIHDIRILGEKGAITLASFGQHGIWRFAGPSQFAGIKQLHSSRAKEQKYPLSATAGALSHAIECFEHDRQPTSGTKNGLEVLRVLDALKKSAKTGGKVTGV